MMRKAGRSLVHMAFPVLATYYRSRQEKRCPSQVLRFLGVADPSYRPDFFTLDRVVREMAPKGGVFAECGVYRGSTLLGMAHRLRMLGVTNIRLVGFDSFEGFPKPAEEDALADGSYHAR